jgi:hypothetical protein
MAVVADDLRLQKLTINRQLHFITETCHSCDAVFATEEKFHLERWADKRTFYCPNGHSMAYAGKSETQKLKEQLDEERRQRQRAEQNVAMYADEAREATKRAEHERRRANGYKGHATKITKRAKAGVCPCCNRSFENLRRHMASKHPQFTPIELDDRPSEGATGQ